MRSTTLLFLYTSAFLSQLTHAAPAVVAIDLGTVTEEIPKQDAPQLATLDRKLKTSDDKTGDDDDRPVQLWMDDFGNIEAVPTTTTTTTKPVHEPLSAGKTSAGVQEVVTADDQNSQVQGLMTEQLLDREDMMGFFSGLSGVLYVLFGGVVLSGLVFTMLRLVTRRRNVRIGHRRGHSRFSL